MMEKAGFRFDEARGNHGQWALEDAASNHSNLLDVAYNGRYHDQLVHELAEDLRSRGGIVIEGFKVTAFNGVTAIADAIVRNKFGQLYVLEVKTGQNPTFTLNQSVVYPFVCFGNHAIFLQNNITELGLVPGRPLPKMPVIVYESPEVGRERLRGDICVMYR